MTGTIIRIQDNLQAHLYKNGYTLMLEQPLNQTNIITVIYAHTGLEKNKCANVGWYGHTPGCTNPISLSQIGTTDTIISICDGLRVHLYKAVTPSYPGNRSTKPLLSQQYTLIQVWGRINDTKLDGTGITLTVPIQYPLHKPGQWTP